MATITCIDTTGNVTLSGTTVDIVNMPVPGPITVCNWSGTTDLTFTVGVSNVDAATPVAGAAETYRVPAGTARRLTFSWYSARTQVRVLGNGNVYSVERG